jgi:hypothetical protein
MVLERLDGKLRDGERAAQDGLEIVREGADACKY